MTDALTGGGEVKAGRELDALVAEKVMGWRWRRAKNNEWDVFVDSTDYLIGARRLDHGGGTGAWTAQLPEYSTDFSAAGQVVEEMRANDWMITVRSNEGQQLGKFWDVEIWRHDFLATSEAEALPHAICLAALKAIEAHESSLPTPAKQSLDVPVFSGRTEEGGQ